MVLTSALSAALMAMSSNLAAAAHVPYHSGATDELFFRGRISRSTTQNDHQKKVQEILPTFLQALPRRRSNASISAYLAASLHYAFAPSDLIVSLSKVDKPAESDERGASGDLFLDEREMKVVYFFGLFIVACLVCWMYRQRGTWVTFTVLCYLFALSSMTLSIRNLYVNCDFGYPQWVTATHFLCTGLVGLCIVKYQQHHGGDPISVPPLGQFAKGVFPVSCVFALSIGSANLGLLYTNAHFYEMIGATTSLMTASLGVCFGNTFDFQLLPPLLLVTAGLIICAFGEIAFSTIGFIFCATAVTCRALKAIVQHKILDGHIGARLNPIELVVWTSWPSFGIMAAWSLYSEGLQPFVQVAQSLSTLGAILLTVVNACILNTASMYVLHELGPVAQQLAGTLKGVLSILGSVALFREQVTIQQVAGYCFIVSGVSWYNRKEMLIKQLKKDATANASDGAPRTLQDKAQQPVDG